MCLPHDNLALSIIFMPFLSSSLQNSFIIKVHECVLSRGQSTPASQLRKKHTELQDKVQGLWNMLHLFEKAPEHFEGQLIGCYMYIM